MSWKGKVLDFPEAVAELTGENIFRPLTYQELSGTAVENHEAPDHQ